MKSCTMLVLCSTPFRKIKKGSEHKPAAIDNFNCSKFQMAKAFLWQSNLDRCRVHAWSTNGCATMVDWEVYLHLS